MKKKHTSPIDTTRKNAEEDKVKTDIDPGELNLLDASGEDDEERGLHHAELDDSDEDGELLNELSSATDKTGSDLDVPGSEDDDDNENLGEEDEENNSYSIKDQD
jgi:hypothetical protein